MRGLLHSVQLAQRHRHDVDIATYSFLTQFGKCCCSTNSVIGIIFLFRLRFVLTLFFYAGFSDFLKFLFRV